MIGARTLLIFVDLGQRDYLITEGFDDAPDVTANIDRGELKPRVADSFRLGQSFALLTFVRHGTRPPGQHGADIPPFAFNRPAAAKATRRGWGLAEPSAETISAIARPQLAKPAIWMRIRDGPRHNLAASLHVYTPRSPQP